MSSDSTKEKILESATQLFSAYGYDSTTTRMIAGDAGVNIATIAFHFENKETLYRIVRENAIEKFNVFFDSTLNKVQAVIDDQDASREDVLKTIELLLGKMMEIALSPDFRAQINLIFWEQVQEEDEDLIISQVAITHCEKPMADLLEKYAPDLPYEQAVLLSRLLLGGIISYNQYPFLLSGLKDQYENEGALNDYIRSTLTPFIMNSIQSYL